MGSGRFSGDSNNKSDKADIAKKPTYDKNRTKEKKVQFYFTIEPSKLEEFKYKCELIGSNPSIQVRMFITSFLNED